MTALDAAATPDAARGGGLALPLVGVGDVSKRILLGRKLRSSQLGETLLPKRIALPVFASDALSSVAYAPDEVFIMLSLAGASAYVWSWKIGIAVAMVMLTVVASYRQNVHAYPSGGGDYEVATVNLGPTAGVDRGQRAARRLRADRGGVDLVGGAERRVGDARPQRARGDAGASVLVVVLMAMNLRGIRESGTFFADPDLRASWSRSSACAPSGCMRLVDRRPAPGRERRPAHHPGARLRRRARRRSALLFLLARAFSSGCAALTGVEAISNGVPAFRKPKSRTPRPRCCCSALIAITMMLSIIVLAKQMGLKYVDPNAPRPADARRQAAARRLRPAPGDRPDRAGGVQRLPAGLLLRGRHDRHHPGAGRQHRVQRLPGARLDPGQGRLRAAGRSARAATGWPTATASSSSPSWRSS